MRVIGTAGHVDHGKSTLVRALSGIDPDRLKEEKARGMTIDLGFAWIDLVLPSGASESVGIVDVPGHIDFIKNMLAGVGGIDAALLVIAADEGVMPQTREHLAILDLLAAPAAVVALTKVDLVDDPDWLDLVELDVHELLQNTHLAEAPIVRVSAATGAGLNELRRTLGEALNLLPPRRDRARPRLPIDRVFSLSGLGTVVTGTLLDGQLVVGSAVEILPGGLPARIRGLQTHKRQVETGLPGSRLAINLSGVSTDDLRRGDVVVAPGAFRTTTLIDVHFRRLADGGRPLVHNQRVDLFTGAAEVPAYARVLGADQIEPAESGWVQLRLDRPVVVAAGDRFILRQPSPSTTLGGGEIVVAHPGRRWRRHDAAVLHRLETLRRGAPDAIVLQAVARQPLRTAAALASAADLDPVLVNETLAALRTEGAIQTIGEEQDPAYMTLEGWRTLTAAITALLDAFHRQYPLRRGMPLGEFRTRLQSLQPNVALPVKVANQVVASAVQAGSVGSDEQHVWRAGFTPTPNVVQQSAVNRLLAEFAKAPFGPPNLQECQRLLNNDTELLNMLLEQGVLVRLGSDVFFRTEDFDGMVAAIVSRLQTQGSITMAEARDLFDTSRKYAQAVLEEMDVRRITRREGDLRVLR